jgi:hypothetical protein
MKNQTVYLLPGRNDTFDDPPGNMIARMATPFTVEKSWQILYACDFLNR